MKKILFALLALTFTTLRSQAQLADGSIAPNFTLTDIDGNSHDLYAYLDAGKTVYIDFFAAHCPFCWGYKNTGAMSSLYANYGPNGSQNQDIVILAIEFDPNNGHAELSGTSGNTQGNWIAELPYPIINPEGPIRTDLLQTYAVNYYPLIYGICPDRRIQELGTVPTADLYSYHTASCALSAVGEQEATTLAIGYDAAAATVHITTTSQGEVVLTDQTGKTVLQTVYEPGTQLDVSRFPQGMYLLTFIDGETIRKGKLVLY